MVHEQHHNLLIFQLEVHFSLPLIRGDKTLTQGLKSKALTLDIWPSNPNGTEDQSHSWPGAWVVSTGDAASGASSCCSPCLVPSHSCSSRESVITPMWVRGQGAHYRLWEDWRIEKGCHSPALGPKLADTGSWQWGRQSCDQKASTSPVSSSWLRLVRSYQHSLVKLPQSPPSHSMKERGVAAGTEKKRGARTEGTADRREGPWLDLFPGAPTVSWVSAGVRSCQTDLVDREEYRTVVSRYWWKLYQMEIT